MKIMKKLHYTIIIRIKLEKSLGIGPGTSDLVLAITTIREVEFIDI